MTRMFDIREPSLAALQAAPVYFRYGSNKNRVLIDYSTASAMLACYNAIKGPDNKAKFERMLTTPRNLSKLVDFCWKHVSFGDSDLRPRVS